MEYEYELLDAKPRQPLFTRSAWVYTPRPDGGFTLKFSWRAWLLKKLHGSDSSKSFRLFRLRRQTA